MTLKSAIRKLVPHQILEFYHFCLAFAGAFWYRFPGKNEKIKIIAVTGTSGKSTTVDFIARIFEEAGNKVASISTIRYKLGKEEWPNKLKMTMPGRFKIQKFLRQALKAKCNYMVLEVTSEGIRQSRHRFIDFDTAVFTNLTPEHIESHGGFENYRKEKLKLFRATKKRHVINLDDENSKYFLEVPAEEKWGYTFNNSKFKIQNSKLITVICDEIISDESGMSFKVQGQWLHINLVGGFNVYNALAAISVALSQGIGLGVCKKALEKAQPTPGRMEIVSKEPTVIVDYAHTPEQLENVYKTFLGKSSGDIGSPPKLICVLGSCGGGRDKWKRPVLGQIAEKYCDQIFITNEDPYDESPMEIINQVADEIKNKQCEKVLDRKEAIKKAVSMAKQNDFVIITGKGAEPWMCLENGKKIPWDDRQFAREELNNL